MSMTREEFMTAGKAVKTKLITVPDFGDVYVREVTAKQYNRILMLCRGIQNGTAENYTAEICGYLISDEDGNRLFNDSQKDMLGQMNGLVLDSIFEQGLAFIGLGKLTDEVDEEVKNSGPTQ